MYVLKALRMIVWRRCFATSEDYIVPKGRFVL